ncbi:MAG TPA: hypothetical protein VMX54_08895 [Vicinamibacteria bacterium]|nr:hypothetical protein [Vicinamibacteria bacterium]
MRTPLLLAVVVLAAAANLASAQEPRDPGGTGRVGFDLVAAPAPGFGVPIRLTRNLTLRATAGFGSSPAGGTAASVGGDLRYTLRPDSDWSAYLSGQASYLHTSDSSGYYAAGTSGSAGSAGLFGGGVGLRRKFSRSTSAYAEARYGRLTSTGVYDSWGMWGVGGQNTVALALGATFGLR